MEFSRVKIVVFTPQQNADEVRTAMSNAGAGVKGEYANCSFTSSGVGRFLPSQNANPHIGERGIEQEVKEERIEFECDRKIAKKVIDAMVITHPYEEVAYDIYPLVEYLEL